MQGMLTETTKRVRLNASTANGTSTVNGASVDMAADGGWDEVTFHVDFETAAANNVLKAQSSSDDGDADAFADIAGSATPAVDTDDTCQTLNIVRPPERYVRPVAVRGTSTVLGTIYAILSRGRKPYAPSADHNVNRLVSPANGTA